MNFSQYLFRYIFSRLFFKVLSVGAIIAFGYFSFDAKAADLPPPPPPPGDVVWTPIDVYAFDNVDSLDSRILYETNDLEIAPSYIELQNLIAPQDVVPVIGSKLQSSESTTLENHIIGAGFSFDNISGDVYIQEENIPVYPLLSYIDPPLELATTDISGSLYCHAASIGNQYGGSLTDCINNWGDAVIVDVNKYQQTIGGVTYNKLSYLIESPTVYGDHGTYNYTYPIGVELGVSVFDLGYSQDEIIADGSDLVDILLPPENPLQDSLPPSVLPRSAYPEEDIEDLFKDETFDTYTSSEITNNTVILNLSYASDPASFVVYTTPPPVGGYDTGSGGGDSFDDSGIISAINSASVTNSSKLDQILEALTPSPVTYNTAGLLTIDDVNSNFYNSFTSTGLVGAMTNFGGSFDFSNSACAAITFDLSATPLNDVYSTDIHCTMMLELSSLISLIMIAVYTLAGFFTIASA